MVNERIIEENKFLEVMREHSDEELLEILNVRRKDYVVDAIVAVEEVLKERGVVYEKKTEEDILLEEERHMPIAERAYINSAKCISVTNLILGQR